MKFTLVVASLLASATSYGVDIVVGFSPAASSNRSAESVVLDAIGRAKHNIHLAAYSFTSKPIASALVAAHKRGIDVDAVLDKSNLPRGKRRYSGAQFLANMGVPVRIDSNYAIMHNKFMVIDGDTIETGSFNYTAAAAHNNAENALLIQGAPELAQTYEREWKRLWAESEPLDSHY